jgi:hypothetical protein
MSRMTIIVGSESFGMHHILVEKQFPCQHHDFRNSNLRRPFKFSTLKRVEPTQKELIHLPSTSFKYYGVNARRRAFVSRISIICFEIRSIIYAFGSLSPRRSLLN